MLLGGGDLRAEGRGKGGYTQVGDENELECSRNGNNPECLRQSEPGEEPKRLER